MTLGTTHASVRYNGDGAIRTFAVTFEFHATTDLEVVVITEATGAESTKALGADYSVTGGDGGTGTVTMNVAPTTAERLVIRRVSPDQQPDDLRDGGPLAAESLERRLDVLAARLQELEMDIARALKVSKGSLATDEGLTLNLTGGRGQSVLVSNNEQGVVLGAGIAPDDVVVSTKGEEFVGLTNEPAMRSFLRLGTAATVNIGTSGANVPLLSGNNIHGGSNTFTEAVQFHTPVTTFVQTDDGAIDGPVIQLVRISESPDVADALGSIVFGGRNTSGIYRQYGEIRIVIEDPTAGSEDSRMDLIVAKDGGNAFWFVSDGIWTPGATGAYKGEYTINVAGGVYKNNVEYTQGWRYGSLLGTSSGTAIRVLSGLPDDIQEIEIFFTGVSTNTNGQSLVICLKDSGAIATSGYISHAMATTTASETDYSTVGFPFTEDINTPAASSVSGIMKLSLRDPGGFIWFYEGQGGRDGDARKFHSSGRKALSDALQEVWLTTPGGTALFDAGSVRARYR